MRGARAKKRRLMAPLSDGELGFFLDIQLLASDAQPAETDGWRSMMLLVIHRRLLAGDTQPAEANERGIEALAIVVVQHVGDRFQLTQQAIEVARHRDAAHRRHPHAVPAQEAGGAEREVAAHRIGAGVQAVQLDQLQVLAALRLGLAVGPSPNTRWRGLTSSALRALRAAEPLLARPKWWAVALLCSRV